MKQENQENIEYLSGEVREILATPPSWVATWGTSILIGTVFLLGLVGVLFEYPDTVTGELTLTTEDPPVLVHSPKSEYVAQVKAIENVNVAKGDVLAVFSSDADYKDVLQLEKDLDSIGQFEIEMMRSYQPNRMLRIGELSQAYSDFANAFELVPLTETGEIDYSTVSAYEADNQQLDRQIKAMEAQKVTGNAELVALQKENRHAHEIYAETTDTTKATKLYESYSNVTNKQNELKAIDTKIEQLKQEKSSNNIRKLQAQTQQKSGTGEAVYQLNQRLGILKNDIKLWKERYLITSPIDGKVLFFSDLKSGQLLTTGQEVFSIVPQGSRVNYVGKVKLPVDRSGKVKERQTVNIKFDRYPFREFGTVKARVSKIYPVASGDAYFVDVTLENGLRSSLNRELDFYQQMTGKAEIVTDNQLFIARLFDKIFGD
ncbi:MAG: HlyD family efflux transporter periplasmic adaptor subunit [Bacteroidetes bacterium]|nr:HlyD family efflux transporter periplasmic adaptor subunit [Bacteroidota bacterium]